MAIEDIPTANSFAHQIEEMVWESDISYIDAVVHWCEARGIELEVAADLIKKSAPIRLKIQTEAEDLKMIKGGGGNRLPI